LKPASTALYIVSKGLVKVNRFSTDKRKQMFENFVSCLNRSGEKKMIREIGRKPHSSVEGKAIGSQQREREINGARNQHEVEKFGCFITVMRDDFWQD
jgi:hypothetical protein